MSLDILAQDLVDRIKAVPAFGGRCGLTIGAQGIDPFNREIPHPAAWVVYVGDNLVDASLNPCQQLIRARFVVKVLVDYDLKESVVKQSLTFTHDVATAIRGGEPIPGSKWLFEGQGIEELVEERIVWAQSYSIIIGL